MATGGPSIDDLITNACDQPLEVFCIVWLDANTNTVENRETEQQLRSIINHLQKFQDVASCEKYIRERSRNERVLLIVSGQLGKAIVPYIHDLRVVTSIYVYCRNVKGHKIWADKFAKIHVVTKNFDKITSQLKDDYKIQEIIEEPLSINIYTSGKTTTGLNGQFLYSQVLIDCLLRLQYTDNDKNELINRCEQQYEDNTAELNNIDQFEKTYTSEKVLWWYSKQCFFYKTLNAILRIQDIHMIFLFRKYIADIHSVLKDNQLSNHIKVYRGQIISTNELDTLKRNLGQFISVNSFFSTSIDKRRALSFSRCSHNTNDLERILFEIDADPNMITTKPFADISRHSHYPGEKEVLFMLGSVFRLDNIDRTDNNQPWNIRMTYCNENESDLKNVLKNTTQKLGTGNTNLQTLGKLLRKMGKFELAEKYFTRLLEQLPLNHPLRADLYEDLGTVASLSGNLDRSMEWHQKADQFKQENPTASLASAGSTSGSEQNPPKPLGRLEQIKQVMENMHRLPEFTTPRYFFILPAKKYDSLLMNDESNWFRMHYKLFFLCECSSELSQMHVAPHEGYVIKNIKRFIFKYGSYLRTTLNMVRILLSVECFDLQQKNNNSPEHDENIEEQIQLINKLIDKFDAQAYHSTHSQANVTKSIGSSLKAIELHELEKFLEIVDTQYSLGNLYRMMTMDGYVNWVCLKHFDILNLQNKIQEYIQDWKLIGGTFDEEKHEAIMRQVNMTSRNVNMLCDALTKGFNILKLTFEECSLDESNLNIFLDVVINRSSVRCLSMTDFRVSVSKSLLSKLFGNKKLQCLYKYMLIEIHNQSLKISFRDIYRDGNMQMLSRLLTQNKTCKKLDFSADEFLGYESDLQRCLESSKIITGLIVHESNNSNILDTIFNLKKNVLSRLKLMYSVCESSTSSYFCELLKKNKTLIEIDLMDPIGFDDETFVVNLLKILRNRNETEYASLHIRNINPSDTKEIHLIEVLRNTKFISRLRISTSVISNELVKAFVYAVKENNTLTHLEFYKCQVNDDNVKQLQSLYSDENLIELVFSEKEWRDVIMNDTNDQLVRGIPNIPANARSKQNGVTVAGGEGAGDATDQLFWPYGLFVGDDQTVIIADCFNHRIVQWKKGDTNGQVVAGGNGQGSRLNQLDQPTDVLIDKETDSLIIADRDNRRVVRWSRRNRTKQGEILIDNIDCWGLAMNDRRYLYVSDVKKHEVRRYRLGDKNGTLVAGGNGEGNSLKQLNSPRHHFVDRQQNVYVSDCSNHRVMKWNKGAKEGIVVAGGNESGNALTQLYYPNGIFVDTFDTLYVADTRNNRVMRWSQGDKEGTKIVGGNGKGAGANQFNSLRGLSFDRHGNLYVVDHGNHRVQRFDVIN